MNSNLKRPSRSTISPNYVVQRKRLKHSTVDVIKKFINSSKGEVIQALHMVFANESFSFETKYYSNLSNKFVCYLNIEGYSFIGYGSNKVLAKSSASKAALSYLIEDFRMEPNHDLVDCTIIDPYSDIQESVDFPDIIACLVLRKYDQLRSEFKQNLPWYKMISGIVMVVDNDYSNGKVVVLSTGSKCVDKQNIKYDGTVVVDAHAEILSRRGFLRFLYRHLEMAINVNCVNSIFQRISNSDKFKIHPNVVFYLFVNSAPCGDCRIFSVSSANSDDQHPNRMSRGLLRIKLDGGNSTVPINNYEKYESQGRLMVMSCSDKLLKMNVLGVQGSLLSYFVEPIYFGGIVISDMFQESHVKRALYERMESNRDFGSQFILHEIPIHRTSTEFKIASKSPKTSINWVDEESIEILNSLNGKTTSKEISRLSKQKLFQKFLKIYPIMKPQLNNLEIYNCFYQWFKVNAQSYQNAKNKFIRSLESKQLGKWIDRRSSLDNFKILPD